MAGSLDPGIFREYDIRGIMGDTLDAEAMRLIGRGFGTILTRKGLSTAAVGYDGRLSSPELEAALTDGLVQSGVSVTRVGLGPSPMLYFAAYDQGVDAGLMITGSHNPPDYNGLKILLQGRAFFGEDIQNLRRMIDAGDFDDGDGNHQSIAVQDAYVARLLADTDMARPLKVAWDSGNGSGGDAMVALTSQLPGEHHLINEVIDGTFPAHHPDPTVEKNLDQLKELVAREGCDLGIGFDGDADRIGVVDDKGRVIWGDQLLVLLARGVLERNPGATIIADVKASRVFFAEIERLGGKPMMWRTGHSHIKSIMSEIGSPLAGEMSAHIFFKDGYYGYDDALYAAVRLLNVVAAAGRPLSELMDEMPKLVNTPEIRFDCADDRKFKVIDEVKARLDAEDGTEVVDLDGVRVETPDGWWLLRASNTQPVLVARCEAADEAGLEVLKQALRDQLTASGIVAPDF